MSLQRSNKPRRPLGNSAEAIFAQSVWDFLWGGGLDFIDTPTIKFSKTTRGISAVAKVGHGGGGDKVSGISYEGDWDPTRQYKKNMIVRKKIGINQGLYIAVADAGAGTAPEYPEPANPIWHLWCFGPVEYQECNDDPDEPIRTVLVHANDVF